MSLSLGPHHGAAQAVSMSTSSLSETRAVLAEHFYSTHADLLQPSARLATRLDVARLGPVTVGDLRFGADVRLRFGELGAYHVDLVLTGRMVWRQGGDEPLTATERTAAVFQPYGDTVLDRLSGDCRVLAVKIDRDALEDRLARLLDAPVSTPIRLGREMHTASGPGRTWTRLVQTLAADAADPGGLAGHPLLGPSLRENLLTGLLLATGHPYRERLAGLDTASPAPRTVRRAMEAMQCRPDHPFTLAELAELAGVSERSLQKGFQRHTGMSPMAYLRDVRLGRVRDDLRRSERTAVTVAQVAGRWGFLHLGRFAGAYRLRFGETPSQTLRAGETRPPTIS